MLTTDEAYRVLFGNVAHARPGVPLPASAGPQQPRLTHGVELRQPVFDLHGRFEVMDRMKPAHR